MLSAMVAPALAGSAELKAGLGGHFQTTAYIDGTALNIVIDTGATTVALSYEDADRAGIRLNDRDFTRRVTTANGITKAATVELRRIELDGVRVYDVEAIVMPQGAMTVSVLGMSFLSKLSSFKIEDGVLYLRN
jgi:aspartyl protease family protein